MCIRKIKNGNILILFAIVVVMWFALSLVFENFGSATQLRYILLQSAFLGIAAAGQNVIILTGGIDLSSGYMISLESVLLAFFATKLNLPLFVAMVLSVLCVMVFGLINGVGVSKLRIPPMVMTLSTGTLIQGIELLITNGFPASINSAAFKNWVTAAPVLGLANTTLVWVAVIAGLTFFLQKATMGRKIYFYGSNLVATRYAGYNDSLICIFAYVFGSAMFALSGLLLVGYTGQSALNLGDSYQFLSIAAVVLGGTSVNGGKGSYVGTVAGVLILIMIRSVLVMLNIDNGGQNLAEGLIILVLTIVYATSLRNEK